MYIYLKNGQWSVSNISKLPRELVKFCRPEDLKYYSDEVSLKFGTLEEYGASENLVAMGARHDRTEGKIEHVYDYSGPANNMEFGGFSFRGCGPTTIKNVTVSNAVNDWILCMSAGPYNRVLHENILYASRFEYTGNPDLTAYVVFDTKNLITAIQNLVPTHPENRAKPNEVMVWVGAVIYNKVPKNVHISHDNYRTPRLTTDQEKMERYFDITFRKPEFFIPESEVRILCRFNAPGPALASSMPVFMNSNTFREAIVDIGHWE